MLSYNAQADAVPCSKSAPAAAEATRAARHAHAAHAIVLGFHSLCCGLPIAATLMASGALGLAGFAALETFAHDLHERFHHYEGWVLGVSAILVLVGGGAEVLARRRGLRRFPAFFAVSVACLAVNAALVVSHRLEAPAVVALAGPAAGAPAASAPPIAQAHAQIDDHAHVHAH